MKIQNVRLGHATNSSSSHSIVLNSKLPGDENHGPGFGWENFHLTTQQSKMCYLAATLVSNLSFELGPETAKLIVSSLLGTWIGSNPDVSDMNVDHQSVITIPFRRETYGKVGPDYEFINDLKEYLSRTDISIFGGNDNTAEEEKEIVDGDRSFLNNLREGVVERLYSIKCDDWWILYNPLSGARITFSFLDNPKPLTSSKIPLLIDLKITDYCNSYCDFCYQSSSTEGKHAELKTIKQIIFDLSYFGVLEIALGGGEPTSHPNFAEIIKMCFENKISVNFSTNSTDWILEPEKATAVKSYVSAIGARPNVYQAIREVFHSIPVYTHLITGIDNVELTIKNLNHWTTVVLLGYKPVGRGEKIKPKPYSVEKILKIAKKNNITLSIDTKFAQMHSKELQKNIPGANILIAPKEGSFSMYIDAVTNQIGADSYSGNLIKVKDNNYSHAIEQNFPFTKEKT